jgi:hypothetical protein
MTLEYTVVNTGNTRLTTTATATVHPVLGPSKTLKSHQVPELLPHGSATVKEVVTGVLPLGRVSADVKVDAPGTHASASTTAWAMPWLLILVAIGIGVIWYLRRRRGRTQPPATSGGAAPPRAPVLSGTRT